MTNTDIDNLRIIYGGFHDSCLRDIYISTSDFVDDQRAMHFDNELTARLLFQRQSKTDSVLELKFVGVKQLHFKSMPENYNGVIDESTLKMQDGLFYWADIEDWSLTDFETGDTDSIWICGRKLFWRLRPELIGNIVRVTE